MPNGGISLLNGLVSRMKYLDRRQGVIAENIANSDTARYRARDVDAPDFSKVLGATDGKIHRPSVGATSRMAELGSRVSFGPRVSLVEGTEMKMNGNNVSLEDEMLKLGEVRQDHTAASNLYRKSLGLLKIATSGRQ